MWEGVLEMECERYCERKATLYRLFRQYRDFRYFENIGTFISRNQYVYTHTNILIANKGILINIIGVRV